MHFTATFRANPPPQAAGMDVDELPAAGTRPDRLVGVRPQDRVQRHTVEHIVDSAPVVPSLDAPVPLMAEQLVDVLSLVAEYETEMDRLEDRILQGFPVSTADREAWRRWVNTSSSSGSKRKRKKRRKRKLPKAGFRPGLRRGRLCDHAAPGPAVLRRVRGGASASVHRQYGGFQLLHRDRDALCKLCRRPSSFSWCSSWTRWTCPLLYNDRCVGLTVQKSVEVPQLQYFDRVVDVPAAVHRQGLDVPVISQRCLRFSSSAELDFEAVKGFFGAFCAIFSRSSGYPELSARFQSRSPRRRRVLRRRGLGGGADAGSFSQVSGHQFAQLVASLALVWILARVAIHMG